jgi:hypothetical protein
MNDNGFCDATTPAQFLALAVSKIDQQRLRLAPGQRAAATALLADLYAVSARHAIGPEHWAAVANLGVEAVDVIRYHDRLSELRHPIDRVDPPGRRADRPRDVPSRDRRDHGRER